MTYIAYRRFVNDTYGSIYQSCQHLSPTTCGLYLAMKLKHGHVHGPLTLNLLAPTIVGARINP